MRAWLVGSILLALPPPLRADERVAATDTQWWQELDVVGDVVPSVSYLVTGVTRFSDSSPNPALKGGGAVLTLTQGAFAYSLGYLYAEARLPPTGAHLTVQIPLAAIKGTLDLPFFHVSDTARIEDLAGVPHDPWRFRNLVRAEAPLRSFGSLESVWLSDEVFEDVSSGRFTRNRILAGPTLRLARNVDLAIAYLNEHDPRGPLKHIQGAFVDLAFRVD